MYTLTKNTIFIIKTMVIYYNKTDSNKEPIAKTNKFNNRLDAVKYFSTLKQLSVKDFIKIFSVEKIN